MDRNWGTKGFKVIVLLDKELIIILQRLFEVFILSYGYGEGKEKDHGCF